MRPKGTDVDSPPESENGTGHTDGLGTHSPDESRIIDSGM